MEPANQFEYIEDLIIARLAGETTDQENSFLDEMIEADPAVRALWEEHSAVYSNIKGSNYDIKAAWKQVSRGIDASVVGIEEITETVTVTKRGNTGLKVLAGAALIAVGIVGYFWYNNQNGPTPNTPQTVSNAPVLNKTITFTTGDQTVSIDKNQEGTFAAGNVQVINKDGSLSYTGAEESKPTTLRVPQGLDYKLTLSDSTKVWVNASTNLSFPLTFTGNTREVTLDGEAYFEVAKNAKKPFIVHTGGMDVKVLGTSFNVRAYKNEKQQASLVEGKVEASYDADKLQLEPGKAAVLYGGRLAQQSFDEATVLAWMKGAYFFSGEKIEDIAPTVMRWFGYELTWATPDIASINFTGALEKNQSIEAFADRLASSANLKYTIDGNKLQLERK